MYERRDEGPDRVPSWESESAEEEQEYQQLLKKQGEQEDQRNWENQLEGDVLGLDDGRPGLGIGLNPQSGLFITAPAMPLIWQLVLGIGVRLLLLVVAVFILKHCAGMENQFGATQPPQLPARGATGR